MSSILIRCPRCGGQSQAMPSFDPVVCVHCNQSFLLPRKLVMEATNTTEEERQKSVMTTKLNEGFELLSFELSHPLYDEKNREALSLFTGLVKDDKTCSRAWYGLFCCLLNQCRKTFADRPKIPGTEFWFFDGVPTVNTFFVESYFYRTTVTLDGSLHPLLYDNTLQPGRKAHFYLHNALNNATDENEKIAMQQEIDTHFTNAPQQMAQTSIAYLTTLNPS